MVLSSGYTAESKILAVGYEASTIVAAPPTPVFSYQGTCSRMGNVAKAKATFRCVLDAYFVDSRVGVLPDLDSNQDYHKASGTYPFIRYLQVFL